MVHDYIYLSMFRVSCELQSNKDKSKKLVLPFRFISYQNTLRTTFISHVGRLTVGLGMFTATVSDIK